MLESLYDRHTIYSMDKPVNITDAEWGIMRILWDSGSATISEIASLAKREREVSTQTIKTLLRRLIDKQCVGYAIDPKDSRVYHYRPLLRRDDAVKQKSEAFAAQVFRSDVGELVAHFVENGELSEDELVRLQRMVAKKLKRKERPPASPDAERS